jgi:hypothetical protein
VQVNAVVNDLAGADVDLRVPLAEGSPLDKARSE